MDVPTGDHEEPAPPSVVAPDLIEGFDDCAGIGDLGHGGVAGL
ncbi:hypothetical protein [Mycolicibacterium tusciae]|nr:hypothetical protein [Mycolicibacterium tusciae]